MAVEATRVFERHRECFDDETREAHRRRRPPPPLPRPDALPAPSKSRRRSTTRRGPAIIMASSGMCNAGRIKHHLRPQHRPARNRTILFIGYQARGTLGRQILEGNPAGPHPRPPLAGPRPDRRGPGLLRPRRPHRAVAMARRCETPPRHLYLVHGEEQVALGFAEQIRTQLNWQVTVPEYRQIVHPA